MLNYTKKSLVETTDCKRLKKLSFILPRQVLFLCPLSMALFDCLYNNMLKKYVKS